MLAIASQTASRNWMKPWVPWGYNGIKNLIFFSKFKSVFKIQKCFQNSNVFLKFFGQPCALQLV